MWMKLSTILWLLLISDLNAALVPPPTNVTLDCQNANVLARWNYGSLPTGTIFIVTPWFGGQPRQVCKKTTVSHELDLSDCIWNSEEQFANVIFVTVTAELGGNESENVTSNTLSFNTLKTVNTKCTLDFPPVNRDDSTVSFKNPLFFYKELFKARNMGNLYELKFSITQVTNGSKNTKHFDGSCTAEEKICRHDLVFPTCVTIKGTLMSELHGARQLELKETTACPSGLNVKNVWIILPIAMSVLIIITLTVIFICKKRARMKHPSALPLCLLVNKAGPMNYKTVPREDIAISTVWELSKMLRDNSEQNSLNDFQVGSDSSAVNLPGQRPYGERSFSTSSTISEEIKENSDCSSLQFEEEQMNLSHYDRPHVLSLSMGSGDHVIAYTENFKM